MLEGKLLVISKDADYIKNILLVCYVIILHTEITYT